MTSIERSNFLCRMNQMAVELTNSNSIKFAFMNKKRTLVDRNRGDVLYLFEHVIKQQSVNGYRLKDRDVQAVVLVSNTAESHS